MDKNLEKLLTDMLDSNQDMDPASITEAFTKMKRRTKILKDHPYSIYYMDGRKLWRTAVIVNGKQKQLQARTREALEDKIVAHYTGGGETTDAETLEKYYRQYRRAHDLTIGVKTVRKYDTDYERYFRGQDIMEKDIRTITPDDLRYFVGSRIRDLQLSPSPAKTLCEYLKRSFRSAVEAGTIARNPMDRVSWTDYKAVIAKRPRKDVRRQTIDERELAVLAAQIHEDEEKGYCSAFAVEFAALTGARVGEVVALRRDRVKADRIVIDASMKEDITQPHCAYVYSTTKNGEIRDIPITDSIRELLDSMSNITAAIHSDFLFCLPDGSPIPNHQVSSWIKNKCVQLGFSQTYGIHALRKTLNSNLAHAGVPSVTRAALLGHSVAVNEQYYTYDTTDTGAKKEALEKASNLF